ncbi:hypothetical protein B0T16DRAFT_68647 [Cercophora newfieldiana]|uniref:CFEM domain-containing protein n=1 Tax=Cercophora newfieldiana TaxID=92897 RepID=A0AA39YSD6_9PEZI|nr:hypothetical protein B0T16DRAFT_68647 [Cercophora newfieldiana]
MFSSGSCVGRLCFRDSLQVVFTLSQGNVAADDDLIEAYWNIRKSAEALAILLTPSALLPGVLLSATYFPSIPLKVTQTPILTLRSLRDTTTRESFLVQNMRYITIASFAAGAIAQSLNIGDLPLCGQICIGNMIALSPSLGCPLVGGYPDPKCFCGKPDFSYGVRDCTSQACQLDDIAPVLNFGAAFCSNAAILPLKPGPVLPTSVPPDATTIEPSPVPEKTIISDEVSTITSGSLTMTTAVPKTLVASASGTGSVVKTQEDVASTLSKAATSSLRGAAASDVQTSTKAPAPTQPASDSAGAPMLTAAMDGLLVGLVGIVAMFIM